MKNIAVKELAYFTCGSGDLQTEYLSNYDLKIGTKAHEFLQSQYLEKDEKEFYIKKEVECLGEKYLLHGFIDGVLNRHEEIIIEEIKSTSTDLDEINLDYHKEHLAQAKIYAYMYGLEHNISKMHIRLTYISTVDYQTKSFDQLLEIDELEDFVFTLLTDYVGWLKLLEATNQKRNETIASISFPFEHEREGQRALMTATYKALTQKEILYTIAPTGIGKTMATMFSGLKSLKDTDKLFYLTAKGSGKNSPIEALNILADKGLKIKAIDITAKKKICNAKMAHCNPDDCPFAKGYFDKLKQATEEIYKEYDIYSSDIILDITNKYQICAFEFSLNLSYYCDVVIADYNYAFDPKAQLIRYFEDDSYKPKLLVDEAHNLISRSKEMYSAHINEFDIINVRSKLNEFKPSVRKCCNKILEIFDNYREEIAVNTLFVDKSMNEELNILLRELLTKCDDIFEHNKKIKDKDLILESYFKILDFLRISEYFSETHRMLVKLDNDVVNIYYLCLDASKFILDTIHSSVYGIVFFSATLYPIKYYSNLLTQGEGKYLELPSPFEPNNLDIIINNEISTKYKNRIYSVDKIIETIEVLSSTKPGNYIVFFPSYQYLNMVVSQIVEPDFEIIIQKNDLNEEDKNKIIDKFKTTTNNKFGFFVMGGTFSEGIDFIGDSLSGVIIVGVGLPMVCDENNLLKEYFDNIYDSGFDYAYTYPGFNKVIQAVGRVIRDYTDRGVAILMDERFGYSSYKELFPPHWKNIKYISKKHNLKQELLDFSKKDKL